MASNAALSATNKQTAAPSPRSGGRAGATGWSQRPGQLGYQLLTTASDDSSSKTGLTLIARLYSGRGLFHSSPNRARCRAGGRAIHAGSDYRYFHDATLGRSIQQALLDDVNVHLHPAVSLPGKVPSRLPYTDVAKPPIRAFAAHLVAEELRTRCDASGELKYQRLARYGVFGIEPLAMCCLKTVKHTNGRLFDHDPHLGLSLIYARHHSRYLRAQLHSTGTMCPVMAQLNPSRAQNSCRAAGHARRQAERFIMIQVLRGSGILTSSTTGLPTGSRRITMFECPCVAAEPFSRCLSRLLLAPRSCCCAPLYSLHR